MCYDEERATTLLATGLLMASGEEELAEEGFRLLSILDEVEEGDADLADYEYFNIRFSQHIDDRYQDRMERNEFGRRVLRRAE